MVKEFECRWFWMVNLFWVSDTVSPMLEPRCLHDWLNHQSLGFGSGEPLGEQVVAALIVYSNRVTQHMYRFKQPFYKTSL